jgi:hypothetical protein
VRPRIVRAGVLGAVVVVAGVIGADEGSWAKGDCFRERMGGPSLGGGRTRSRA